MINLVKKLAVIISPFTIGSAVSLLVMASLGSTFLVFTFGMEIKLINFIWVELFLIVGCLVSAVFAKLICHCLDINIQKPSTEE